MLKIVFILARLQVQCLTSSIAILLSALSSQCLESLGSHALHVCSPDFSQRLVWGSTWSSPLHKSFQCSVQRFLSPPLAQTLISASSAHQSCHGLQFPGLHSGNCPLIRLFSLQVFNHIPLFVQCLKTTASYFSGCLLQEGQSGANGFSMA